MKKILLSLLCVVMFVIITGCNKNNGEETNPSANNGEVNNQTGTTDSGKIEENNDVKLVYTFKDPSKPVAFDYPNLKSIEEGTSHIFKNARYIIAYCRDVKGANLKDIPTELFEEFKTTTSSHMNGTFSSFEINETKEMNINNVKVLMIKGHIISRYDDGSTIDLPMKGYAFEKDGIIVELIGYINEENNDDNQKEMEKTIDAMIKTLRSDR